MENGSVGKVARVKQLLFKTATETNLPKWSSAGASPDSPILQRGGGSYDGKDEHEGYGRINVDAAIEAAVIGIAPEGASVEEELFAGYNGFDPLCRVV